MRPSTSAEVADGANPESRAPAVGPPQTGTAAAIPMFDLNPAFVENRHGSVADTMAVIVFKPEAG